jgi:1,4-alpha-glucan branching enzyme
LLRWVRDLNTFYRGHPSLYEVDFKSAGFEWVDCGDHQRSILSFLRRAKNPDVFTLFICNFTPVPRYNYRVGAPVNGLWKEALNSDALLYGGSGVGNFGQVKAVPEPLHAKPYSLRLTLPPLGILVLQPEAADQAIPFDANTPLPQ